MKLTVDCVLLLGKSQLVPIWQNSTSAGVAGRLVDLEHGIYIETSVVEKPNVIVPIAIHGNGVTCLLLNRKTRTHEQLFGAQKVGIANFPSHILAQTTRMGAMSIESQWDEEKPQTEVRLVQDTLQPLYQRLTDSKRPHPREGLVRRDFKSSGRIMRIGQLFYFCGERQYR
jgi:hypothetical protein